MTVQNDIDWEDLCSNENIEDMDYERVFGDVDIVEHDDGPNPVCSIAYKPSFQRAMNYFRGVIRKNEFSSRALKLTSVCLKHNPANYTVWHYRRACFKKLCKGQGLNQIPIELDLEFAAKLGGTNPKNYQVWYHRRALLEIAIKQTNIYFGDLDNLQHAVKKELGYIESVLRTDAKNYHVSKLIKTSKNLEFPINDNLLCEIHRLGHTANGC